MAFYAIWIIEVVSGLILNLLFLLSLIKADGCTANTYVFLASLAVTDMLASATLSLTPFRDLLIQNKQTQDLMCLLGVVISSGCLLSNMLHTLCMGIDRYIAINYPHR